MHPWLNDRTHQLLLVLCVAVLLLHGVGAALLLGCIGLCVLGCWRGARESHSGEDSARRPMCCGCWSQRESGERRSAHVVNSAD